MARLMPIRLLPKRPPTALIDPIVRALAAAGVSPAAVTIAGLVGSAIAAVLVAREALIAGGIVMLVAGALDMFDGALARATGRASPFGALLDSTLDRVGEAVVLFGVLQYSLGQGHRDEASLAFVVIVASLMVSYVRARAEGLGEQMTDGLFSRPERVAVLGVALITGWLLAGLWVLAVLSSLTALQRLVMTSRALLRQANDGEGA